MEKLVTVQGGGAIPGQRDFGRKITEEITAATTLKAEDTGKVFFINAASATASVDTTLPPAASAAAGWEADFVVKAAPTGSGAYVLTENTSSSSNALVVNGINELEVDTSDDGPYHAGCTTVTFAASTAVAGDHVNVLCDGSSFHVTGQTKADGGITLA